MLTLGLTGGVASGKSLAAKYFAELGAVVLDADLAGHEVLREPQVRQALIDRWGTQAVTPEGEVDRAAVAARVFGNSPEAAANRQFLEDFLHPQIYERLEAERAERAADGKRIFILDAPLLLEAGWDSACDVIVFVEAPREVREARALARGWSAEQFAQREAAQWPVEKKRDCSDWILRNDGSPEELRARVNEIWPDPLLPKKYPLNLPEVS